MIEILVFPAVQLLDVAGPLQVFATTNDIVARAGTPPPYRMQTVAQAGFGVMASAGLGLAAASLPALDTPLHTLVVAGGPGVTDAAGNPALLEWLRARAAGADRVASVCTGAFLLAAAGLLDGRRATTHWASTADLARRFPAIEVDHDPIFVRDGTVWTSAGVTAGIDLALALVEEDLGRTVAMAVARHLVMFLKRKHPVEATINRGQSFAPASRARFSRSMRRPRCRSAAAVVSVTPQSVPLSRLMVARQASKSAALNRTQAV